MKRSRRAQLLMALSGALAVLLLASCVAPQFYTHTEIEALLSERYGLSFTVGEPRAEGDNTRIYPAACAEYPDLPFEAADVWSPPGWHSGGDGVPPLPHGANHSLRDSLRAASWNRYAVPLLALYGVKGLEIAPANRFWGVDYFADGATEYRILLADDIDAHTDQLDTLLRRLDSLPGFREAAPEPAGRYPSYGVPVSMTVADGIGNTAEHLRLTVGHGYGEQELAEALATLRRTVRNNLKREMERAGAVQAALDRAEYPTIGSDFFYLSSEESGVFPAEGAFSVPATSEWSALSGLAEEADGTPKRKISISPSIHVAERSWYCATLPADECSTALRFCIDPETGAIWQYAPSGGGVFLIDTGAALPPGTLPIFAAAN
ncbi:MAG: hypothetical protein HFH27_09070 [Clostridiaceae bacterium]|nr:hypothetical protein [Clostridiaceae bacterium]